MRPLRKHRECAAALLCIAGMSAGCDDDAPTQLVAEVFSDLVVPDDVDEVRIDVKRLEIRTRRAKLAAAGSGQPAGLAFPVQEVISGSGNDGEGVEIRAVGLLGGQEVVSQAVVTAFQPRKTKRLALFLGRRCVLVECPQGLTCQDSICVDPWQNPDDLPVWDAKATPPTPDGGSGKARDGGRPLDGGMDVGQEATEPADAPAADFAPDATDAAESAGGETTGADTAAQDVGMDAVADAADGLATGLDGAADALLGDAPPVPPSWTSRTPATLPPSWPQGREGHVFVYDSDRRTVLLFGGAGPRSDTWELDPATGVWTDWTPSPLPAGWPLPGQAAGAYDSDRKTVVLAGLEGGLPNTYEWNCASHTWTDRTPSPLPASWPGFGTRDVLAYDAGRKRTLVVGGANIGSVFLTWEWDGAAGTWTDRAPAPLPASWPGSRASGRLAYNSSTGTMILFGGRYSAAQQDVWEWNGTAGTWTDRTPAVLPPSWPVSRSSHGFVFDSDRRRFVLFGGLAQSGELLRDQWEWEPSTGVWLNLTPLPFPGGWPSGRSGHGTVYDVSRRRVVLFGGSGGLADLYEWDHGG